ncbi:response regulator [Geomonas azotofigens]|uniref:response regulator n=1 Tax=Geomonas azotofigens TaxID=2843196 RepID=UPI001C106F9F|nr:response regulator [Geomonas azotofigens]MBU5613409.1 response regulator [Geomonas azotofigens]
MQTVLVVEDEADLAELIAYHLEKEGFRPIVASDGNAGLLEARNALPDLILLDLMLPGMMGTELCRVLKSGERTAAIPIIMLTAKGEEIDRVVGFEVGADDYVVKPFSTRELMLRVRAVLRRTSEQSPKAATLVIGDLVIDTERHLVSVGGKEVALTSTEYKLLMNLAERTDRVQSRELLLQNVWGYNYLGDTRTVDTHLTRLRTKLGPAGDLIKTVRGFGYKLEKP